MSSIRETLEIEGALVRHIRTEIIGEVPLESISERLVRYERSTLPILPHATGGIAHLSFDRNSRRGLILVSRPPGMHTLPVSHRRPSNFEADAARRDDDGISRFRVQLPWQYFAFNFTFGVEAGGILSRFTIDGNMQYWRPTPLAAETDVLWPAACPNVNSEGGICWGGTLNYTENTSLARRVDDMVNNFYNTTFNEDLGHRTPYGQSMTEWEEHSQELLSYTNWDLWDIPGITLESMHEIVGQPVEPIAVMNPSFVNLPSIPENFTVARARQELQALNEGARRRLIAAVRALDEEPLLDNETAPAVEEEVTA